VTSGPDHESKRQPLAEEDDWFAASPLEPSEPIEPHAETPWHDEPDEEPLRSDPEGLGRRQAIVVGAVVLAIVVGAAGILLARSLSGSDSNPSTAASGLTGASGEAGASGATGTTGATGSTGQTTTETTPTTTTGSGATSVPAGQTLKAGMTGSSVVALQKALAQLGYAAGTADGTYGPSTTAAVTAFQTANGLTADGTAGPQTIAAINKALASG
jgi:hypothetical protein